MHADPVFADLFAPERLHNHSSCLVECPDGALLACWYRGSGERTADDVAIMGARKAPGKPWSPMFPLADTPGFPDTNPILTVDTQSRLWLFWGTQLDNRWESTLLKFRRTRDFGRGARPPRWETDGIAHFKPDDEAFPKFVRERLADAWKPIEERADAAERAKLAAYLETQYRRADEKLSRRLGWFGRCHPFYVGKRMVLPLYSDGFDCCLFAWSEDDGASWTCSLPLLGPSPVQPSVLRRRDGTLVAYCRNNGPAPQRILSSESRDEGRSWSPARHMELSNPGASVEALALADGRWALCGNDTEDGRHSLAIWLSRDEGKTWPEKRMVEAAPPGAGQSFHYPSLIQARNGAVHVTYSRYTADGQTIRHAAFAGL